MPRPASLSVVFMLGSTTCLATGALFGKMLSEWLELHLLVFLRLAVPGLMMLALAAAKQALQPRGRQWRIIAARSVFIALTQFCFVSALFHLSLIEAAVLFSTGPLFIPLLERLVQGRAISKGAMLALSLSMLGVVIQSGILDSFELRPELLFGLAAGFFNACSQVVLFRGSQLSLSSLTLNGWFFTIAALFIAPLLSFSPPLLLESSLHSLAAFSKELACLLAMALMTIGTQVFRTQAYRRSESTVELAPLIYSNLAIAALFQVVLFEQQFSLAQITGLGLIAAVSVTWSVLRVRASRVG